MRVVIDTNNWKLMDNDPDDNKFVDCYMASGADHIVTNDGHFRRLRNVEFPVINIISGQDFLGILEGDS